MEIEAPNTPALAAAQAEYRDIMTNPQNPRHAGLHRGDRQVSEYIDKLYADAVPDNKPVPIGNDGVSLTTDFSEDAQSQAEVETALRQEFGDTYDGVMRDMSAGAQYLFGDDQGQSALTVLADRITGLGPRAEALGIKFLADLATLQSQGGMR